MEGVVRWTRTGSGVSKLSTKINKSQNSENMENEKSMANLQMITGYT